MPKNIKNKLTVHAKYLEYEVLARHDPVAAKSRRKMVISWAEQKRKEGAKTCFLAVITLSEPDIQGFTHDLFTLQEAKLDKVAIVCDTNNIQLTLVNTAIATFAIDHPMKAFTDRESALSWLL
jgi:hypothetical protein